VLHKYAVLLFFVRLRRGRESPSLLRAPTSLRAHDILADDERSIEYFFVVVVVLVVVHERDPIPE